jgi:uncharacterized membrane protein
MTPDAKAARPTYSTERLSALADGVFAVALTLLVLDLKPPQAPPGSQQALIADLEGQIPNLIAWLISFVLVARFWVVHHAIVASLARCHVGTMAWNFVVLALMSLVPFAAALIGAYEFDAVAVFVFAALMGVAGLSLGLFARHAASETHLQREEPADDLRWHWRYHSLVLPVFAALSVLLSSAEEVAALLVWAVEPLVAFFVTRRRAR